MVDKKGFLLMGILLLGGLFAIMISLMCYGILVQKPYISVGDRVFEPNEMKYGYVVTAFDWPDHLPTNVRFDDGNGAQVPAKRLIKVNGSKYLQIGEFSIYPTPLRNWYANRFEGWHCKPPIADIKNYCEAMYGNYSNRYSCYKKTDNEIIYYDVVALNVTLWKWQGMIDNTSNMYKEVLKTRNANQNYRDYEAINYALLCSWMNHYGLRYNNRSLHIDDFDEIKRNVVFMCQYCRIYGYTGYDEYRGCYRVY